MPLVLTKHIVYHGDMSFEMNESQKPWWTRENRAELNEILFKAAQGFVADIDPALTVEKIGDEPRYETLKFTYFNDKGIDKWRSFNLALVATLYHGDTREEFEAYAREGKFQEYVRQTFMETPHILKSFTEAHGLKVPQDVFANESEKRKLN